MIYSVPQAALLLMPDGYIFTRLILLCTSSQMYCHSNEWFWYACRYRVSSEKLLEQRHGYLIT